LLGNEFLWTVGGGLFPRLGAIMISYPEFQVLKGSCECITPNTAPPPLTPVVSPSSDASVSASSLSSFPATNSSNVDPLSGLPLVSPPQDARFSYLDVRKRSVTFLKVSVNPSVIAIGERDYLEDAKLDNNSVESSVVVDRLS